VETRASSVKIGGRTLGVGTTEVGPWTCGGDNQRMPAVIVVILGAVGTAVEINQ